MIHPQPPITLLSIIQISLACNLLLDNNSIFSVIYQAVGIVFGEGGLEKQPPWSAMKIFDVHTHIFPEKIAASTLAYLSARSANLPTFTLGTSADLRRHAIAAGYAGWMNCPVVTKPGQAASVNAWAAARNQWPALSLGGVHPDDEDLEGVVRQIRDLGLCGVKFHPEYQAFGVLEPRVEPIWRVCEELSLPVLIHGGQDIGFQPPFHSRPRDYAELSRRHPGLVIIIAHLGGWRNWDEVEHDLVGRNVFLDTSFALPFMEDKSQFVRIVRQHGADKVLFGTDSPWQDLAEAVSDVSSQPLTQAEKEDIFWNNAARIWNFPVDAALAGA